MKLIVTADVHIEFDENRDHPILVEEIAVGNTTGQHHRALDDARKIALSVLSC